MLLLLASLAHATTYTLTSDGPVIGVMGGVDVALDADPASATSPTVGVLAGYRFSRGALYLQPELLLHMSMASPMINAPLGVSVTTNGAIALGGYAHVSAPIAGSYPWPGLDAGAHAGVDLGRSLKVWLRSGWEWNHAAHYKCGDCPQPSDHWWVNTGGVSFAF